MLTEQDQLIKEGIERGKLESKLRIANNMLNNKFDLAFIAKITQLHPDMVEMLMLMRNNSNIEPLIQMMVSDGIRSGIVGEGSMENIYHAHSEQNLNTLPINRNI